MEFTSYNMVADNTASLNTGSYLNRVEYSLFVKGFTTDLWYGLSEKDVIEIGVWDRAQTPIGWNVLNQSKSYNQKVFTYLNALNIPVAYSYSELNPDFILYKNSKILVNPPEQLATAFDISSGSFYLNYNFTRDMAGDVKSPLIVKEISPSRTEIKLIPVGNGNASYNAFCKKKILTQDVSPLYLETTKTCEYGQIYNQISPNYQSQINTIKSVFFLQTDGAMVNFLKNLYEDQIIYTTVPQSSFTTNVITGSLIRIQGIKTYFSNYLLSNSTSETSFTELDNQFGGFVSASIERKFFPIGKHPLPQYVDAKKFVYEFFTTHYYKHISDILSSTYNEKYFEALRNGLNIGNNRILPILQHGMMDERVSPSDPLTLLVKLKSSLPNDIAEQSTCWVSNISLTPYVVNAIAKDSSHQSTYKIGVPDFSLPISNVSLTNANMAYTKDDLSHDDATERELTIGRNISELSVDYTNFYNFILFSSAEIRLKIFKNKIINISSLTSSLQLLNEQNEKFLSASGSFYPFYEKEYQSYQEQINDTVNSFDGYESYLYRGGSYNYVSGAFVSSSYISEMDNSAISYDKNNRDSLINNCPSHILSDSDNNDYIIFLSMIGHFFDGIYEYISNIPSERKVGNSSTEEFTRRVVDYMLETFGWNLDDSLEQTTLLNNYLTSEQSDGLNSMSAEERLKTIRNRILINLPQIYKTKGTEESVRLILACYGIPSTLLSVREYGGRRYSDDIASYTTYERSYMYQWHTSSQNNTFISNLTSDAKTYLFKLCLDDSSIYNYGQEIAIMGSVKSGSLETSDSGSGDWAIGFVREKNPNSGKIWFRMGYKSSPLFKLYSSEFPLFDGNVYSVMLRRDPLDSNFEFDTNIDAIPASFGLYVQRNEFGRNILRLTESKISYDYTTNNKFSTDASGSYLIIGDWFSYHNGASFRGAFDKLQVWYDPITNSNFEDYVNSINSYSFSGSRPAHQSLLFRMHTDYPFDLTQTGEWVNANKFYAVDSQAKVQTYLQPSYAADMSRMVVQNPWVGAQELVYNTESGCFISQSVYPFQFKVIDYPSTWGISKYGSNKFRNEKVRYISQSVEARFDNEIRSTYSDQDDISPDSNQIGFFADPQDFRNKDIIRYFGNFDVMDAIGDPANQFVSGYDSLRTFRNLYQTSLNQSTGSQTLFNELMILYKLYFNKSVFESIRHISPARSNTLIGIVIEPTILERSKYESKPIFSEANTGSVFYSDITVTRYLGDSNTKLARLSMSLENSYSINLGLSYVNLPTVDYPINYGGNYISDVPDKYGTGHFILSSFTTN